MGKDECCATDGNKCCRVMRALFALAMLGLLTCMATSLWRIENHLSWMVSK